MSSSSQLLCRVLVLRSLHLPSQSAMGFCCLQSLPLTLGARSAPFSNTNPQPHPQPPGMPAKWNPFIQIYVSLWALVSVQLVEQNWKLSINSVWQNMQTCLRKYLTDSGGSNQGGGGCGSVQKRSGEVAQSSSRGVKRCKHLGDIEPSAQSDSLLRNLMRKIH